MTGKVIDWCDILQEDYLGKRITEKWLEWDMLRNQKKNDWEDIRRYVYATDTSQTSNSTLPWKNKTTVPKLCQIRDNLYANYVATLFPQRKNIIWEANEKEANSVDKRDSIVNYLSWAMEQPSFKSELDKIILDYIDFGNCFPTVEWSDQRVKTADGRTQAGYVGPSVRRISPLDIVFNPTSESFESSPKIVKSMINIGELKKLLSRLTNDQNQEEYEGLWKYLKEIRSEAKDFQGDLLSRDRLYQMDGFTSYREYLKGDYCEVLTFYGDIYDPETDTFLENHIITVVDRHKVIASRPNPSFFGYPPIFHAPWRKKQDNLWGMGPLDNLVGLQYRMDHVENMKADIYDLTTFPVQKIKGFVEDFTWQPGEKIFVSDEGDVELLVPDVNALQANFELDRIERLMEEMAGAPREAMGFRTPGEKTKYEVQRLENAAARVFQNKIKQFEEQILEPLLNAMLELARRNLTGVTAIKVFDDEYKVASFQDLTIEDITGIGRIKPVAARHFAEQAELIQNLTTLSQSPLMQMVAPHVSAIKLTKILEDNFNIKDLELFQPFVGLAEQAQAQKYVNSLQKQVVGELDTPTGIGADFDPSQVQAMMAQQGQGQEQPPAEQPQGMPF